MWWMLAAAGGAKLGMSLLQGQLSNAQAEANNRISKVNAETGNKTREYRNSATAATNNLARWTQSLNNKRILEAGGRQLEANTQNFLRQSDAGAYDDINRSLGDAETLGSQAAQGGAVGAIGGVADMVDTSTRIRSGIVDQLAKDQKSFASHDNAVRAGMIFSQTVQSLDSSLILDSFDFGKDYAVEQPTQSAFATALPTLIETASKYATLYGGGSPAAPAATSTSPYSLTTASNAKFGFKLPTPDTDLWSLGAAKLGSATESSRSVNPYSLWSS